MERKGVNTEDFKTIGYLNQSSGLLPAQVHHKVLESEGWKFFHQFGHNYEIRDPDGCYNMIPELTLEFMHERLGKIDDEQSGRYQTELARVVTGERIHRYDDVTIDGKIIKCLLLATLEQQELAYAKAMGIIP